MVLIQYIIQTTEYIYTCIYSKKVIYMYVCVIMYVQVCVCVCGQFITIRSWPTTQALELHQVPDISLPTDQHLCQFTVASLWVPSPLFPQTWITAHDAMVLLQKCGSGCCHSAPKCAKLGCRSLDLAPLMRHMLIRAELTSTNKTCKSVSRTGRSTFGPHE